MLQLPKNYLQSKNSDNPKKPKTQIQGLLEIRLSYFRIQNVQYKIFTKKLFFNN